MKVVDRARERTRKTNRWFRRVNAAERDYNEEVACRGSRDGIRNDVPRFVRGARSAY